MWPANDVFWLLSVVALCSGKTLDPNPEIAATSLKCPKQHTSPDAA